MDVIVGARGANEPHCCSVLRRRELCAVEPAVLAKRECCTHPAHARHRVYEIGVALHRRVEELHLVLPQRELAELQVDFRVDR
jgi:hypothetical protein